MNLLCFSDEKLKKAFQKNIAISLLILVMVFLWDNKSYLWDYLPYSQYYEKTEAYMYDVIRHNYGRVDLCAAGIESRGEKVKHDFREHIGDTIVIAHSGTREPAVCRCNIVITGGFLAILIALLAGNVYWVLRVEKAMKRNILIQRK